jgi:murein DD-endopeptidase MepM/ murein hydrolase activator NlpD
VPHRRHRSRGLRLGLPVALGIVALLTTGSIGTGSIESPGPVGAIGAVAGAAEAGQSKVTTGGSETGADVAAASRPLAEIPDARLAIPGGAPDVADLAGYRWPLPRGRLTQDFGPTAVASRVVNGQPFHDGIDLATFCGDRVVAAHDGVVLAASRQFDDAIGWLGDLTPYYERLDAKKLWLTLPIVVVIDDGNGYRSMYAHFEKVVVKPGQRVRAGQFLGYEGRTGNASGCHVHYGLFSPFERGEISIERGVAKRMKLPRAEIARIDPLLVLPARPKPTPRAGAVGPTAAAAPTN